MILWKKWYPLVFGSFSVRSTAYKILRSVPDILFFPFHENQLFRLNVIWQLSSERRRFPTTSCNNQER